MYRAPTGQLHFTIEDDVGFRGDVQHRSATGGQRSVHGSPHYEAALVSDDGGHQPVLVAFTVDHVDERC